MPLTPHLHFTREELAARRERALALIAERQLDGALLFRQESAYYLTGFDTFGYVFFQCLYLHRDGRMTLLTRSADLRQAQLTSVIDDIRIWRDAPDATPAQDLRAIVGEYGDGKRFGIEWDSYGLTAHNGRQVAAAFADCELVDFSDAVSALRVVKSPAEIAYAKKAAALADDALTAVADQTRAGAYEGDLLAALQGAIFRGGGEYSGNEFILGSGERALLCRSYAGRRCLSATDQLTLEYAGAYRHYHAAMMRTILVGEVTAAQRDMHKVAVDAFVAAKGALRPGDPIGNVFDAYANTCDSAGMRAHRLNATGYSLGACFAPSWMDTPMFYHGNPFVAAPNMIFFLHIILADSERGIAMSTGETLLVTDTGAQGLSSHPHTLITR